MSPSGRFFISEVHLCTEELHDGGGKKDMEADTGLMQDKTSFEASNSIYPLLINCNPFFLRHFLPLFSCLPI
jgi:hypothetical protein